MNAAFDSLVKSHFDARMEMDPLTATHLGLHQHDHRMPEATPEALEAEMSLIRTDLAKLEAMSDRELDHDRRLDLAAMRHYLAMSLFEYEEMGLWRSYPTAVDVIGMALYPLFSRDFAPFPERARSIASRLEQIPRFLEESKRLLTDPVLVWVALAVESSLRICGFMETIIQAVRSQVQDTELANRVSRAGAEACKAVDSYRHWMLAELMPRSRPEFAIGREKFDRLIVMRRLGMTTDEIYHLGEEILEHAKGEMERLARELDGGADAATMRERLKDKHPNNFEEVLKGCREQMQAAREFVIRSGYATLPAREVLAVEPTPQFMAHIIPFAAYIPPGKFDTLQKGQFLVTPVGDQPERLRDFHWAALVNKAVHEGYPGHHLQLACANTNPSLARLLGGGVEFIEGWAHYCEEAVAAHGFADSKEVEFERYADMVWRACRILIDIRLCSGEMTYSEAVRMLMEVGGYHEAAAQAEIRRYTFTPGYQLSYLLGKHLIIKLKDKMQTLHGAGFSERRFHDAMLYAGNLPMFLMQKAVEAALEPQPVGDPATRT